MAKQDDYVRYTIRVPADLYAQVADAAGEKSVNAEIVARLLRSFEWSKLIEDLTRAEERLAEQARTERELREQIELLKEQVAMLKSSEMDLDLTNAFVQDEMVKRLHDVMGSVVEDMREEHRVANGMPLLLRWFDQHPDERAEYNALSDEEQDEYVREKTHELWIQHLNEKRAARTIGQRRQAIVQPKSKRDQSSRVANQDYGPAPIPAASAEPAEGDKPVSGTPKPRRAK